MATPIISESKRCKSCGEHKRLSDFYSHPKMKDGHLNSCIPCVKSRVMDHRVRNLEKIRAYDRSRGNRQTKQRIKELKEQNRERYRAYGRDWAEKNQEKRKAQIALNNALRDKRIKKANCVVCGSEESEAHHEDYSKHLDVVWLCKKHHMERHKQINEMKRHERHERPRVG